MEDPTWHVYRPDGTYDEVTAATWWTDHGDLLLGYVESNSKQGYLTFVKIPSRGFAAGRWTEVVAAP